MRCECGCGGEARPNKRFIHGHRARLQALDFDKRVRVDPATGCHIWTGLLNAKGYGRFGNKLAHRIAWERERGQIPRSLQPDHVCRNHACVNVKHIELVTPAVNTQRGDKAKLTIEQVVEIRRSPRQPKELAVEYGIAACTISNIRARRTWRDV